MALHGHTKIELTDVNTGEVEVYEDDNMVTNFIQDNFHPQGFFGNSLIHFDNKSGTPSSRLPFFNKTMLKGFTNGILLFDKSIEENPEIDMPPGGVLMTGRGYDAVYNGDDPLLGSYNANESRKLYDGHGYKYVWDFSTNQGNGTIASVCLTTCQGGYYGIGQHAIYSDYPNAGVNLALGSAYSIPYKNFNDTSEEMALDFNGSSNVLLSFLNANNYSYFPGSTSYGIADNTFLKEKKLFFRKRKVPFNEYSLFSAENCPIIEDNIAIELNGIDNILPENLEDNSNGITCFYYRLFHDNDTIYFLLHWYKTTMSSGTNNDTTGKIAPNELIGYVWRIDKQELKVKDYIKLNNTTGHVTPEIYYSNDKDSGGGTPYYGIVGLSSSNRTYMPMTIIDNKVIIVYKNGTNSSYPHSFAAIDLDDQSSVHFFKSISDIDKENALPMRFSYCSGISFASSKYNKVYSQLRFDNSTFNFCFDLKNYAAYRTPFYYGSYKKIRGIDENIYINLNFSYNLALYHFPAPLVTINNLPQIITKTSSQTMKVTYTIIDDEYAESIE